MLLFWTDVYIVFKRKKGKLVPFYLTTILHDINIVNSKSLCWVEKRFYILVGSLFNILPAPDRALWRFECTNCVRDLWNLLPWMLERVHLLSYWVFFFFFLLLHSCSCGSKSLFCNTWWILEVLLFQTFPKPTVDLKCALCKKKNRFFEEKKKKWKKSL